MKETLKKLGLVLGTICALFIFTGMAVSALDKQGTERLIKDYEYRMEYAPWTVTDEYIKSLNSQLPKAYRVNGHCIVNEEYERESLILQDALRLYDSFNAVYETEDADFEERVTYDECLSIARTMDDFRRR